MKKIFLAFGIIFISVIAIIILNPITNKKPVKLSKSEETKALEKVLGRQANTSEAKEIGDTRYDGSYIHVLYPANAVIHPTPMQKSESFLENFGYNVGMPSVSVSIQAQKMDGTDLSGVPGVMLRRKNTAIYLESKTELDGNDGTQFMTTASPYESVAFVLKKGVLYTLSAIGITEHDVRVAFEKARASISFSS